jgi:hypothetical protein
MTTHLSDFDKSHIGEIIHYDNRAYEWTSAHIIRFIDRMISKGASDYEMGTLYALWPEYFDAVLDWYGWPKSEQKMMIARWISAVG